ncbi:type III-B CRISPR module-associated protein Cmr5 [Alienimonas californiensis]|uniref:CRISPR type III-B/RAMP module-associated protein Cmr5 n=1 Tax=Alienimonas californiensis TaxID=2527989 RepID=A0A517P6Q0_9PLAN|nr:type III-B CRISPR module-associated protein Cmr5 [Alienimonas californiensis]QDT15049.1 CRISPR-associated protein (Cas_Cmr5) [Alienimonas californiensis]
MPIAPLPGSPGRPPRLAPGSKQAAASASGTGASFGSPAPLATGDVDRRRAAFAWERIAEVRDQPDDVKKRYRGQSRSAGALIQRNGLGQAFAFWASKGFSDQKPAEGKKEFADVLLYRHLGGWIVGELTGRGNLLTTAQQLAGVDPDGGPLDPLAWLMAPGRTTPEAVRATGEALALLHWLRRFADSQLPKGDD